MGILKKIFGICETKKPEDPGCWAISGGRVEIDLKRAGELSRQGGAIRLEGKSLTDRILVIRGENGLFYAYKNKCTHMGRRIDPVSGSQDIRCCSVMGSRFGITGEVLSGPAKGALKIFEVKIEDNKLNIDIS
ncbi:MAG: Rieske (2Fe-2S) protein [Desulfobacterales bacterium]|jgi:nitrite reductase/ring-hydroxylating ferredoxin subunit|nr:Rieske (2Fe-2S) protein [Desulfobacterales bacterium]